MGRQGQTSIAASIAGTWIRDGDMHPATNIYGRRFWARGNIEGEYRGWWPTNDGLKPADLWWHFPNGAAAKETP